MIELEEINKMNDPEKGQGGENSLTIKDLFTENPRWCVGCGDFGILAALKRFIVERKISPEKIVNISGIGCSGRAPNYINTYGVHSIHGRPITIAMGLALTRPDLKLFIHSGDGDALSIGGNHFIHGVNKNFDCIFLMYDNSIYALTKNQTSPTTEEGHVTNTQPSGTFLKALNPVRLALGAGASFVASTADWMPDHFSKTLDAAYDHKGFSFIHISQRCPHFYPKHFDIKDMSWFSFLQHEKGIAADKRIAEKTEVIEHDFTNLADAFKYADSEHKYFGLFYKDADKLCYSDILQKHMANTKPKNRKNLINKYKI